jgi:hypothetical protein
MDVAEQPEVPDLAPAVPAAGEAPRQFSPDHAVVVDPLGGAVAVKVVSVVLW